MAFKLESNPLENNPLFAPAEQPKTEIENKPSGKPAKPRKAKSGQSIPAKKNASQNGGERVSRDTDAEYIRATFIVRKDLLKELKDYAYTERREIKEVINEILEKALDEVEAQYAADGRKMISR